MKLKRCCMTCVCLNAYHDYGTSYEIYCAEDYILGDDWYTADHLPCDGDQYSQYKELLEEDNGRER